MVYEKNEKIKQINISLFFKLATTSVWIGSDAKIKTVNRINSDFSDENINIRTLNKRIKQIEYKMILIK